MKIILVATDSKTKSVVFVSNTMQVLSLQEVLRLINSGALEEVHVVQSRYGNYVRSAPNATERDNLDAISVFGRDIISYAQQTSHSSSVSPISSYLERYHNSLKEGQTLKPIGQGRVLVSNIKRIFKRHISLLKTVPKEFEIDPYLLGAILIDELARMNPFEQINDMLGAKIVGRNVSVGIMQVTLDTANQLIKKGLYNPNPTDKKLPFKGILSNENRAYLYKYLIQPKHNVRFAAAHIRNLINQWRRFIDISQKPEIIATLYSPKYKEPHSSPKASDRGLQIATEFYKLSKKWLT